MGRPNDGAHLGVDRRAGRVALDSCQPAPVRESPADREPEPQPSPYRGLSHGADEGAVPALLPVHRDRSGRGGRQHPPGQARGEVSSRARCAATAHANRAGDVAGISQPETGLCVEAGRRAGGCDAQFAVGRPDAAGAWRRGANCRAWPSATESGSRRSAPGDVATRSAWPIAGSAGAAAACAAAPRRRGRQTVSGARVRQRDGVTGPARRARAGAV